MASRISTQAQFTLRAHDMTPHSQNNVALVPTEEVSALLAVFNEEVKE